MRPSAAWKVSRALAILLPAALKLEYSRWLRAQGTTSAEQAASLASSRLCDVLGVHVITVGKLPEGGRGALICSNHIGYLEILVLRSLLIGSFVAEAELRHWPVVGRIMESLDTVFVDRRSPIAGARSVRAVAERLARGRNVIMFPEGTPSRGDNIAWFKSGLFEAAVMTGSPIIPVLCALDAVEGLPALGSIRDRVCWYRDEAGIRPGFAPHFASLASLTSIDMRVYLGEPIWPDRFNRKQLALRTRARMIELRHM